jgi:hypothetical protein
LRYSLQTVLCKHITDDIQIGKCEGCIQIVYDINNMTEEIKVKMRDYGIKAVPTTVIDGNIKVVGIPDFLGYMKMIYTKIEKLNIY